MSVRWHKFKRDPETEVGKGPPGDAVPSYDDDGSSYGKEQRDCDDDARFFVVATNDRGEEVRGSAVVVAVPVTILKRGAIAFDPPLPAAKQAAIASIEMRNAAKVVLSFSRRIWPAEAHGAIGAAPGCAVPEMWMHEARSNSGTSDDGDDTDGAKALEEEKEPEQERGGDRKVDTCGGGGGAGATPGGGGRFKLTGFATGARATSLAATPEQELVDGVLEQLVRMFGVVASVAEARDALVHSFVFNWADEPFVGGGYSVPTVGEGADARQVYAAPCGPDARVAFAGEATNFPMMTMHAAMDSGRRAAGEIAEALGRAH